MQTVTLVDDKGYPLGAAEKYETHQKGWCHLAFSIFIVDVLANPAHMLLQKRHPLKYHSGGLWSNACCGHPSPGEQPPNAAHRRLFEELGFFVPLTFLDETHYCLDVSTVSADDRLIENEWNHVFIGEKVMHDPIDPNPQEVSACKWMPITELIADITQHPETYSAWLPLVLSVFLKHSDYKNV